VSVMTRPPLLILMLAVSCSPCAVAEGESDLFELSLTDLSQIRVTVSSHRPESLLDTPSIVTRLDSADLRRLGLTDLTELLSFVPGMTVQNHLFGQPFVSVRGVYEGFNQKVLFLLDDTPYFMSSHSDIPLKAIPLEAISHVEIIRGPGAVYYGTNATAGVIKVVTKTGEAGSSAKVTVRSTESVMVSGGYQWQWVNHHMMVAGQTETPQKQTVYYPEFDSFSAGDVEKTEHSDAVYARWSQGQTQLVFHGFHTEYAGIAQPRTVDNVNQLTYRGFLLSAQHSIPLSSETSLKTFMDYNQFALNFLIDDFIGPDVQGGFRMGDEQNNYRLRAGANIDAQWLNWLGGFAGLEWEKRSTSDYEIYNDQTGDTTGTIMPAFSMDEWSAYGQLDVTPYEGGRLVIGARYTDNEIIGESVVPRLAWVQSINDTSSIKVLYSVGFNTPSFTQLKADFSGVVNGNSSLSAEQIASLDVGYFYQAEQLQFGVTAFRYTAKDFVYSDRSSGEIEFYNSSDFSHQGLELEWEYRLQAQHAVFANTSYLFDGNEVDVKDNSAQFSPRLTMNFGYHGQWGRHSAGMSVRYVGERASAEPIWLVNVNYQVRIKAFDVGARVVNLAQSDQNQPNMAEFNERLVPMGESEPKVEVTARYRF